MPAEMLAKLHAVLRHERRVRLQTGLARACAILLTAMLLMMALDWVVAPHEGPWRWIMTVSALACGAVALVLGCAIPFLRRRSIQSVAEQVDRANPSLQERFQTTAEFAQSKDKPEIRGSEGMIRKVAQQTAAMSGTIMPRAVVSRSSLICAAKCFAAAAVVLAVFFAIDFPRARVLTQRFLQPGADITLTRVQSKTGDLAIAKGENVTLEFTATGKAPDTAKLLLHPAAGRDEVVVLEKSAKQSTAAASKFTYTANAVSASFDYSARAGDGRTTVNHVTVLERPALAEVQFQIEAPPYSKLPVITENSLPRQVRALEGSKLEISFLPDQELSSMELKFADGVTRRLEKSGDNRYHFSAVLSNTLAFEPVLTTAHHLANQTPPDCQIIVYPDLPPTVNITSPNGEISAQPDDKIQVEFQARDDFGLSKAELVVSVTRENGSNSPPVVIPIPLGTNEVGSKFIQRQVELDMSQFNLNQDDQLNYSVRATDTRDDSSFSTPLPEAQTAGQPQSSTTASAQNQNSLSNASQNQAQPDTALNAAGQTNSTNQSGQNIAQNQSAQNNGQNPSQANLAQNQSPQNAGQNLPGQNNPQNQPGQNNGQNPSQPNLAQNQSPQNAGQNQRGQNNSQNLSQPNLAQNQSSQNPGQNQSEKNNPQNQPGQNNGQNPAQPNLAQNQSPQNPGQNQSGQNNGQNPSQPNLAQNQSPQNAGQNQSQPDSAQNQSGRNSGQNQMQPNTARIQSPRSGAPGSSQSQQNTAQNQSSQNSAQNQSQPGQSGQNQSGQNNPQNQPQPNQSGQNQSGQNTAQNQSRQNNGQNPEQNQGQNQASPPDNMSRRNLDVAAGQTSSAQQMRIQVDQSARSFESQQREKQEMAIDPTLKRLDELLRKAYDLTASNLVAAQSPTGLGAEQSQPLEESKDLVRQADRAVVDLKKDSTGTPYAFIGLQVSDIGETHIAPAREELGEVTSEAAHAKEDRDNLSQASFHLDQARKMLAALTTNFNSVKRDNQLADAMQQLQKMHQIFLEDTQAMLGSRRQPINSTPRKMAEVDDDYAAKLQNLLEEQKKIMAQLAKILADDPRMLRRFMASQQSEAASLRDQMTLLAQRQQTLATQTSQWSAADETNRPAIASQYFAAQVPEQAEVSSLAAKSHENMITWLPDGVDAEKEPVATALNLAEDGARLAALAASQASPGNLTNSLDNARKALDQFRMLHEYLPDMADDPDTTNLSVFTANRLNEAADLVTRESGWIKKMESLRDGDFSQAAEVDQHRLTLDTETLNEKLGAAVPTIAAISEEIQAKSDQLLHTVQRQVLPEEIRSVDALARNSLKDAVSRQQGATNAFAQAETQFDELLRMIVSKLDSAPPPDDPGQNQTLDDMLAMLQSEQKAAEELGIPNRPLNIEVMTDWLQQNSRNSQNSQSASSRQPGGQRQSPGNRAQARAAQQQARENSNRAGRASDQARRNAQMRAGQLVQGGADVPEGNTNEGTPKSPSNAWNTLASKLGDELRQGRDNVPPEQYRQAIEQYFNSISETMPSTPAAPPTPAPSGGNAPLR